ncbi:hypothetical protein [Catellatospora sp. IY07-71]|uniref:hypothetical protein n=1 Tax=Catellatospora sp. IY07-71 TaxID=2728827 RepID=UPI001BB32292|nr:hypothetical protein [Catellatospora sp. IY07-71]
MIEPSMSPQLYAASVERPRRRRWPWVLAVLALLSFGCCGVLALVSEPIRDQYPVRAVVGTEIAGLRKDASPQMQAVESKLVADIRAQRDRAGAIGVKLDDPKAKNKPILLAVVTTLILDPTGELDQLMAKAGDGTLRNVQAFDALPRGGELKCAHTDSKVGEVVVCGWIDHGSLGIALFFGGRSIADSAQKFQQIRAEILVKE